jgi:hypothetical protein
MTRYELRVQGAVSPGLLGELEAFEAEAHPAITVLRGAVDDEAALRRLLDQLYALGLELLEVRRIDDDAGESLSGA